MPLINLSNEKQPKNNYMVKLFYGSTNKTFYTAETLQSAENLAKEKLLTVTNGAWVEIFDSVAEITVKTIGKNNDGSLTEIINKSSKYI